MAMARCAPLIGVVSQFRCSRGKSWCARTSAPTPIATRPVLGSLFWGVGSDPFIPLECAALRGAVLLHARVVAVGHIHRHPSCHRRYPHPPRMCAGTSAGVRAEGQSHQAHSQPHGREAVQVPLHQLHEGVRASRLAVCALWPLAGDIRAATRPRDQSSFSLVVLFASKRQAGTTVHVGPHKSPSLSQPLVSRFLPSLSLSLSVLSRTGMCPLRASTTTCARTLASGHSSARGTRMFATQQAPSAPR